MTLLPQNLKSGLPPLPDGQAVADCVRTLLTTCRALFEAEESILLLRHGDREIEVFRLQSNRWLQSRRPNLGPKTGFESRAEVSGEVVLHPAIARCPARSPRKTGLFPSRNLMAAPVRDDAGNSLGVLEIRNARWGGRRFLSLTAAKLLQFAHQAGQTLTAVERLQAQTVGAQETHLQLEAAQRQLRAARESLQQSDLAQAEVVSIVAHELRNPITSIVGFSKLLLKGKSGPLTEEQSQFCQIIQKNSENLEHLIFDLLDITKLDQGRLELRAEVFPLTTLARESVLSVQASAPGSEDRIRLDLPAEPVYVRGDRMRLIQVITNLLGNALKYSPPQTPILLQIEEDRSQLRCSVHNQGNGLAPDQLERVFEKFYRIKTHAAPNISGSGLGLAIARSLIHAHHGRIWAENALEGGVVFRFELPMVPAPAVDLQVPQALKAGPAQAVSSELTADK